MKYINLFIVATFLLFSCQSEVNTTEKARKELAEKAEDQGGFQFVDEQSLCNILDKQKIEEIFGVAADKISYKKRGYIFKSPVSASCEAQWETNTSVNGKVVLQMFCNRNTEKGQNFGDKYIDNEIDMDVEGYSDKKRYQYREVEGIGDRAVLNPGFGLLKWYVGNYMIYSLQIQTSATDYSDYKEELQQMAKYVTGRTVETLQ